MLQNPKTFAEGTDKSPHIVGLEENMPKATTMFDAEERWDAQKEVGRFLFDNALDIGLYGFDVIWPLGTKVASWKDHIRLGDTRNINGMEYARPR